MEKCGFFDAQLVDDSYDRVYLAENFAAYFASFIGNGVFGGKSNELQVLATATPTMQVSVQSGQGWINGYWYENTDALQLPLSVADGVLNRIDSIVLRLDFSSREMYLKVVKGTPANSPMAPALVRNADYYDLQLATVKVIAGAVNIRQSDITDTRMNTAVCGLVCGLIQQFDTTSFGNQLQTFIVEYMTKADLAYDSMLENFEYLKQLARDAYQAFLNYLDTLKAKSDNATGDFLVWLSNLKATNETKLNEVLEELKGLIGTDVAAGIIQRLDDLEELEKRESVATITHDLNAYVHCDLYEFEYGAGVGGAGLGAAGGTPITNEVVTYTMSDRNNIEIKAKAGYGVIDEVNKIDDKQYVVSFKDETKCLLILLRV